MATVQDAVDAFVGDAGCEEARAQALVEALSEAATEEALEIAAGEDPQSGTVVDGRVARLRRVIDKLEDDPPNAYEISVMFRVTVPQARTVLNTYRARYSSEYRQRMQKALPKSTSETDERLDDEVYLWRFTSPEVLEYAVDKLKRHGFRSIYVNRAELELRIRQSAKSNERLDAREVLHKK